MSLRFFADQCVPGSIIRSLREVDHEVLLLKEHLPVEAPDPTVIAKAQELDSILISLNGDFADIVSYPPDRYRGIIAFQVRNHPEVIPSMMSRLKAYLSEHSDPGDYRGRLLIIEPHRIRSR